MEKPEVRIVQLDPMRVASAQAFGPSPEGPASEKLLAWARSHRLFDGATKPRIFGFNNPSPSAGSPNYGYEVWITVGPEVQPEGEVAIKEFGGGRYAVTRCVVKTEEIPAAWQRLVAWVEASPHAPARHQWLEEHVVFVGAPPEEMVLDLYMPIR